VRDWSHRYLAYGARSFRAATLSQLQRDPRLAAAWVQRNVIGALASASAPGRQPWRRNSLTLKRDWAVSLGNCGYFRPSAQGALPGDVGGELHQPGLRQ